MKTPRQYETTYILTPDVDANERQRIADRVQAIIETQFGGTIVRIDDWGRRQLAYAIDKYRYGIYIYIRFDAAPETIAELERVLRLMDAVLKFLTVQIEPGYESDARPDRPARETRLSDDDDDDEDFE